MTINEILKLNRRQTARLIEGGSIRELRKTYEASRSDLETRLAKLVRDGKGETFTAHHMRMVLLQVREGLKQFTTVLNTHLATTGRRAGDLAYNHLVKSVKGLEKRFTGLTPVLRIEEAGVYSRVNKKVTPSLLNRYKQSEQFYTKPVVKKIRETLAHATIMNETVDQAVDRIVGVDGVFANQRWRAERIARTEMAYAYGTVQHAGLQELAKEEPAMKRKLIATFDDRTGDDSKELHGQIRAVNEPFEWVVKNSKGIPTGQVVKYMFPPNRPLDREVVIPWKDDWKESAVTAPQEGLTP